MSLSSTEKKVIELSRDKVLAKMLADERIEAEQVDVTLLLRLLRYIRRHPRLASIALGLATFEAVLMTAPAFMIGLAIDRVIGTDRVGGPVGRGLDALATTLAPAAEPAMAAVVVFGIMTGVIWLVQWATGITATYAVQKLGQQVVHDLRVDVFNHVTSMDLGFFHKNPVGRLVNRTTFDVQTLAQFFSDAVAQGLRDVLFILVLIFVMLSIDPVLAGILLCSFPLLFAVGGVYQRFARPALRSQQAVQSRMTGWIAENIAGMRENQLYRQEPRRRDEFEGLTTAHQAAMHSELSAWGFLRPAMMMVSAIATAVVLLVGYNRVLGGFISVGILLTFIQYTGRLWIPVRNLTQKLNLVQSALTAGERIFDILDRKSAMKDAPSADASLEVANGAIHFKDVEFSYPGTDVEVLSSVSFEAAPGDMIALVGDTGAGKSTIANLISRFYDVTGGTVLIDGNDVRDYLLHNLRVGIGIVPQDVVVFAGTVRDNITLGTDVSDERLTEAVRAVKANFVFERWTAGLDHVLDEGGRTLSVGERQLLSFARALVFNPPILILDEATANVDTETEMAIQTALAELTAGRTTVVIAHRLSTIRDADTILVLRNGNIVEQGNHDALLAMDGEYKRLHDLHHAS